MKDYHINIFYSEEDDAYIADIPDLKYCSAHGTTPEEALAEVLLMVAPGWVKRLPFNNDRLLALMRLPLTVKVSLSRVNPSMVRVSLRLIIPL